MDYVGAIAQDRCGFMNFGSVGLVNNERKGEENFVNFVFAACCLH